MMTTMPDSLRGEPVRAAIESCFVFAAIVLLASGAGTDRARAQEPTAPKATVLAAGKAKVTGSLKIRGVEEAASIHFWNQPGDTISWTWPAAREGRYRVEIHYALDRAMRGGKFAMTVGDRRFVAPAEPSGGWTDFRTFDLGVIGVEEGGDLAVVLQAAHLPSASGAALPDVAWLCLTPTDAPVTLASESGRGELRGNPGVDGEALDEATHAKFEALGWKVGIQSYTFTKFSLFEAIDAASALGLKAIEATTWQKIEPGKDDRFNPWWMSQETRQKIMDRCKEKGVTIVSVYCRPSREDIEKQSDQVEKIFQFCRQMKLALTTDPVRVKSGFGSMAFYDDLCKKYEVRMFLTNHPRAHGSPYSDPDTVLADCEGRSKYIGASLDVGHFMRDGIDVYEAVRKYTDAGRMAHFHFRDVDRCAPDGKDVALGTGAARIRESFRYMHEKGARPLLLLEYERDQEEPLKYIIPSLEFLKNEAPRLTESPGRDGPDRP